MMMMILDGRAPHKLSKESAQSFSELVIKRSLLKGV
jgi:hypothetical protein